MLAFWPVTFLFILIHSLKRYNASTSCREDAGRADRVNVNNEKLLAKTPASVFGGRATRRPLHLSPVQQKYAHHELPQSGDRILPALLLCPRAGKFAAATPPVKQNISKQRLGRSAVGSAAIDVC